MWYHQSDLQVKIVKSPSGFTSRMKLTCFGMFCIYSTCEKHNFEQKNFKNNNGSDQAIRLQNLEPLNANGTAQLIFVNLRLRA